MPRHSPLLAITDSPLTVDGEGRRRLAPEALNAHPWLEWTPSAAAPWGPSDAALRQWGAELASPWSLARFAHAHAPAIGPAALVDWDAPLPSVLDMLIRAPDGPCRLPAALASLRPFVEQVLAAVRWADDNWDARYLYLTVDQRFVAAGAVQRIGGWHVDGLMGPRHGGRQIPLCGQVLAVSHDATPYAVQPFAVEDVDLATTNLFRRFEALVDPATVLHPPARHLVAMHGQHVHTSPRVTQSGWRTLLRVEGSHKRFDRLGNTRWDGFAAETDAWDWQPRPIPSALR